MTGNAIDVLPEAGRPDTTKALELAGGLNLEEIKSIGTVFWQSGMFKDTKSVAQAITKVMAGQELGIPPMMAMRGVHVVDGNPQLSAGLVAALVKRSGRYDYRVLEASDTAVVIEWRQRTDTGGWEIVGQSDFTRAEAETANLLKKANWQTYTEDMLFARALTRGARRYCPDVFGGAVYAPGEAAPDQDDLPPAYVQTAGDYKPPRIATLHEDAPPAEGAGASYSASEAAGTGQPEEPHIFDPDASASEHRDPHDD